MNILIFLGMLALGTISLAYTRNLVNIFGRMDWAERWFGVTGTYTAWKLIGVALIVGGMLALRYF